MTDKRNAPAPDGDEDARTQEGIDTLTENCSSQIEALKLVHKGYFVFPLAPRSKKPKKGTNGFKDATIDLGVIQKVFGPDDNIAIRTGQREGHPGVWVFDVDTYKDDGTTFKALIAEHGELPKTPMQKTGGGGLQYFFEIPEGVSIRNRTGILPGLDVRGEGGYVVAPYSIHPVTGVEYEWVEGLSLFNLEPAEAPDWLLELVTPKLDREAMKATVASYDPNGHADEFERAEITEAIEVIDPDDDALGYAAWRDIGLAIYWEFGDRDGFDVWDNWCSKGSQGKYEKMAPLNMWKSFHPVKRLEAGAKPCRKGTIFMWAKKFGWAPDGSPSQPDPEDEDDGTEDGEEARWDGYDPIDDAPEILARAARAHANDVGCSEDAAMQIFDYLVGNVAGKMLITYPISTSSGEPNRTAWQVKPVLNTLLVASTGSRKSDTMRPAAKFLLTIQDQLDKNYETLLTKWNTRLKAHDKNSYSKNNPTGDKHPGPKPKHVSAYFTAPNKEALYDRLGNSPMITAGWLIEEFYMMWDSWTHRERLEFTRIVSVGFDGGHLGSERKTVEDSRKDDCLLACLWMMQTKYLHEMITANSVAGVGLFERFEIMDISHEIEDVSRMAEPSETEMRPLLDLLNGLAQRVVTSFKQASEDLANTEDPEQRINLGRLLHGKEQREVTLSPEAFKVLNEFQARRQFNKTSQNYDGRILAGNMRKCVARAIARATRWLILEARSESEFWNPDNQDARIISADLLSRAIRVTEFRLDQTRKVTIRPGQGLEVLIDAIVGIVQEIAKEEDRTPAYATCRELAKRVPFFVTRKLKTKDVQAFVEKHVEPTGKAWFGLHKSEGRRGGRRSKRVTLGAKHE